MRHAACIVGNSSAGIRESCYFGTPTINIGSRQKNRTHGSNTRNVDHNAEDIYHLIKFQISQNRYPIEYIYGEGMAGERIADVLYNNNIEIQK